MMSYTVMGDVVNLASRLEGANKLYGTRNLVSEATIAMTGGAFELREVDRIVVDGHTRSEVVLEVIGPKGKLTPQQLSSRDMYLEGLAAYRERRWDDALHALEAIPGDGPSAVLISRIEHLKTNPPPEGWDGSSQIEK